MSFWYLGHWGPWEDGSCSEKPKQVWHKRTCKNWKGIMSILVASSLSLSLLSFFLSFSVPPPPPHQMIWLETKRFILLKVKRKEIYMGTGCLKKQERGSILFFFFFYIKKHIQQTYFSAACILSYSKRYQSIENRIPF